MYVFSIDRVVLLLMSYTYMASLAHYFGLLHPLLCEAPLFQALESITDIGPMPPGGGLIAMPVYQQLKQQ
jgi:hypothetical protein